MEINNPIDIVRTFAGQIQNGRTLMDIHRHANGEMKELKDEILALKYPEEFVAGPDGVVGEAIDVIACMLDAIFVHAPETTDQQINEILLAKCAKWARRYKDSIDGDRSID